MQMTVHYYSGKETNNVQILLQDTTNRITSWPDERGLNFDREKGFLYYLQKSSQRGVLDKGHKSRVSPMPSLV